MREYVRKGREGERETDRKEPTHVYVCMRKSTIVHMCVCVSCVGGV